MERNAVIDIDDTTQPVDETIEKEEQEALKAFPPEAVARGILNSSYPEVRAMRQRRMIDPVWIKGLPAYPLTVEAYQELFESKHKITVASARTHAVEQATLESFEELGLTRYVKKFIFRPDGMDIIQFKMWVNEWIQPDVTFEDNGSVSVKIARRKSLVYVVNQRWNQNLEESEYLKLCSSLYSGVDHFLETRPLFFNHVAETANAVY